MKQWELPIRKIISYLELMLKLLVEISDDREKMA